MLYKSCYAIALLLTSFALTALSQAVRYSAAGLGMLGIVDLTVAVVLVMIGRALQRAREVAS